MARFDCRCDNTPIMIEFRKHLFPAHWVPTARSWPKMRLQEEGTRTAPLHQCCELQKKNLDMCFFERHSLFSDKLRVLAKQNKRCWKWLPVPHYCKDAKPYWPVSSIRQIFILTRVSMWEKNSRDCNVALTRFDSSWLEKKTLVVSLFFPCSVLSTDMT